MRTRVRCIFVLFLCCALSLVSSWELRAEAGDRLPKEAAPTLRASDLLVSEVLRGPGYELEEFVQVEHYKYFFKIRTEWGLISAHGLQMLELKLREIQAIDNARQRAHDQPFVQGVFSAVKNSAEGAKALLVEPNGALLRSRANGSATVRWKFDPNDRRAGGEGRRRLAVDIGCDPETNNPLLKNLLDGLAVRKGVEGLAAQVGLPPILPGLSLLALSGEIKELVASTSPHEVNSQIEGELASLGIPEPIRSQFCHEVNYSTTQRLLLLQQLRPLREVKNLHLLVEGAVEARNEADGLAVVQELRLLNEIHQRDQIREVSNIGLPLASTRTGKLVIVCAADYVTHTRELADAITTHRRDFPKTPTVFYTSGRVSALAKRAFAAARIDVIER